MMNILKIMPEIGITLSLTVTLILASISYFIYYRWKHRRYFEMMAKIPGPPAWPLLGHLHLMPINFERFLDVINRCLTDYPSPTKLEYGPIVKYVFLSKPEHLQILYNSPDAICKIENLKPVIRPLFGDGLFMTADVSKWRNHRKTFLATFTPKILESFVSIFIEQANILAECLQKEVGKSEACNVWNYVMPASIDTFCRTAMGVSGNSQTQNSIFCKTVESQLDVMMSRVHYFWRFPDATFKYTKGFTEQQENLRILNELTESMIHRKRKELQQSARERKRLNSMDKECYGKNPEGKSFLDYLLELTENDPTWTHEDIRDEVNFFNAAGFETTAKTISFVLMSLAFHPDIQDKVFREQNDLFGDSDRPITVEDINKMTYLDMVIRETLRLYPTVSFNIRQLSNDLDIGDHVLPKGAGVIVWLLRLHMHPEYWPNPEKFDPERFLPEETAKRHPYAYLPFSGGLRICIGYRFAMMSMKTTLSTLLRQYKFTSPLKKEDLKLVVGLTLIAKPGYLINVHKR